MKTGWEVAHKFDLELGPLPRTSGSLASWSQTPVEPVLRLAACFLTGKKWQQAVFFKREHQIAPRSEPGAAWQ